MMPTHAWRAIGKHSPANPGTIVIMKTMIQVWLCLFSAACLHAAEILALNPTLTAAPAASAELQALLPTLQADVIRDRIRYVLGAADVRAGKAAEATQMADAISQSTLAAALEQTIKLA